MARSDFAVIAGWLSGQELKQLKFSVLWKILLVRIADRATDIVDEVGGPIDSTDEPYNYDLSAIVQEDDIRVSSSDLLRAAVYLDERGFGELTSRTPPKVILTRTGMERANKILENASEYPPLAAKPTAPQGLSEPLQDWLLVHGFRAFDLGNPFSKSGMVNFREVANGRTQRITDRELKSAMSDLEYRELITQDSAPAGATGKFWAYFNSGGEVAAKLLEEIWGMRSRLPAADRFVRLDDNAPRFEEAIGSLERLIAGMHEIRVNDWPEKEGMLASVKATVEMIRTKYVNKTTIFASISSVATFLMAKFAEAPISELANAAWTAVKSLF